MAPEYLSTCCQPVSGISGRRHLRSADCGHLDFPHVKLASYGGRSFAYAGPSNWNSLPAHLRDNSFSLSSFRRHLKTFLFSFYYASTRSAFGVLFTKTRCINSLLLTTKLQLKHFGYFLWTQCSATRYKLFASVIMTDGWTLLHVELGMLLPGVHIEIVVIIESFVVSRGRRACVRVDSVLEFRWKEAVWSLYFPGLLHSRQTPCRPLAECKARLKHSQTRSSYENLRYCYFFLQFLWPTWINVRTHVAAMYSLLPLH